jgi:hypothetical protein
MFSCRSCGTLTPQTPARVRSYNWICYKCSNRNRDQDIPRYLTRKLAEAQRYKGFRAPYPGVDFVRRVIQKCEGKSVVSGCSDLKKLCVVLLDDSDEAVLLTSKESHDFTRKKNLEKEVKFDQINASSIFY